MENQAWNSKREANLNLEACPLTLKRLLPHLTLRPSKLAIGPNLPEGASPQDIF